MPSIINKSFFVGEINITNTDELAVEQNLNLFIEEYERTCLVNLLGLPFYKELMANRTDDRMLDLVNGADYTTLYRSDHYDGIKFVAYYIYYWFETNKAIQSTSNATILAKGETSVVSVSPKVKLLNAWNKFCNGAEQLRYFLIAKKSVYPEYTMRQHWMARSKSRKMDINYFDL